MEATQVKPASAVEEAEAILSEQEMARQRRWVMGIVNVSHAFNHMNSAMMPILFAVMMEPLGFGFGQLGVISAVHSLVSSGMQASYGFITKYVKRGVILGVGNLALGLTTIITGSAQTFGQLVVLRAAAGASSSPQHPVGSTILSSYFQNARGRALALHTTAGNVGTVAAPLLAAFLIYYLDWRVVLVLIGIPSVILGLSYFWLRDVVRPADSDRPGLAKAGWGAYVKCLKNRNLMLVSLLMMVGAAGRDGGINQTYLVPHFMIDLGIAAPIAATLLTVVQFGGLIGPFAWGWVSDLFERKLIMQISLVFTAITTLWLGQQGALDALLLLNLAVHGLVVTGRGSITQAMVGDYADDETQDAAFSIYFTVGLISAPLWAIIIGTIMQTFGHEGFSIATKVMACSYILGMLILMGVKIQPRPEVARSSGTPSPSGRGSG